MSTKDGGPAFPSVIHGTSSLGESSAFRHLGMFLRDWFAGRAMTGFIADTNGYSIQTAKEALGLPKDAEWDCDVHWPQLVAKQAYAIADAMLAAREVRDE